MTITFREAYELPIAKYVEKKGKFSYLSWAAAVKFLRENYPDSTWDVVLTGEGLPIHMINDQGMVCVNVYVDGNSFTQWHPCLNHQNKPIANPSVFDINTSIHRCLAKAIGIATGIGLGLYLGEDLPDEPVEKKSLDFYCSSAADAHADGRLTEWRTRFGSEIRASLNEAEQNRLRKFLEDLG